MDYLEYKGLMIRLRFKTLSVILLTALIGCSSPSGPSTDGEVAAFPDSLLTLAKQGDAEAQQAMAMSYDQAANYEQAAKWYRKAACQGLSNAQNNLGVLYKDGQGLPQDSDSARYWFSLAAQQGLPIARKNLEKLYR